VKWKPPRNADIEEIELKPPPIIPATNRFHERVELTPAEEDHTPYQLGAYDNLRAITHKRELAHLRKPVVEWTGEVREEPWIRGPCRNGGQRILLLSHTHPCPTPLTTPLPSVPPAAYCT
jgi:hypothetical protein